MTRGLEILDLLEFPSMNSLEYSDKPAHDGTCDWILADQPTETTDPPQFMPWTRNDESLFWISGKAASGKSTLMKHIYYDDTVHTALEKWAGKHGKKLLKAGYFFVERAGDLEKCREGMLRSLLYQILNEQRHLISVAFPRFFHVGKHLPRPETVNTWESLSTAFAATLEGLRDSKVCLFIDGLDEYRMNDRMAEYNPDRIELITEGSNGDEAWGTNEWIVDGHVQIAKLILQLRGRPNTKICFSSRLLNAFETRFQDLPGLQIHRYTAGAIKKYCTERLEEEARGLEDLPEFVTAVTEKSLGVFLWVRLVIDRLVAGNDDGYKVSELWDTLEKIPQKLNGKDGLYMKMMENVAKQDRDEAARLFCLVMQWDKKSSSDAPRMDIITLFLAEEGYLTVDGGGGRALRAKNDKISPETWETLHTRWVRLQRRLRSRCGGLLEGSKEVQFMHLTAKEFLSQKRWWDHLFEPRQGFSSDKETELALISGIIRRLKCCAEATINHWEPQDLEKPTERAAPVTKTPPEFLCHMVSECLDLFYQSDSTIDDAKIYEDFVDELDYTCDQLMGGSVLGNSESPHPNWIELLFYNGNSAETMLSPTTMIELAISSSLERYAILKLQRNIGTSQTQPVELLGLLAAGNRITFKGCGFGHWSEASPGIMKALLVGGMDPNLELQSPRLVGDGMEAPLEGTTVWTAMLRRLPELSKSEGTLLVMELLLQYGADPAARVRRHDGEFMTPAAIIRKHKREKWDTDWTAYPRITTLLQDAERRARGRGTIPSTSR
jgi:hypothetical protein